MAPQADAVSWLDLDTSEDVLWVGRPGVSPVVPFLVIGVGIAVFGVFLAALVTSPSSPFRFVLIGLFIGLGLFVAGWRSAERRSVAYAITSDAVYEKRGPSESDVSRTPRTDIESASVEQSALARLVDRGTVRCYAPTANRTTLTLDGIGSPEAAYALLTGRSGTTDTDHGNTDPDSADPGPDGVDADSTSLSPDDGSETASDVDDTVRAYVVDVTDDAVLLRAFTDAATSGLDRGRRVSITIRPGSDGHPSPGLRQTSTIEASDPGSSPEPGPRSHTDSDLESSDGYRAGREEGTENDEERFAWGSTSADEGDRRRRSR